MTSRAAERQRRREERLAAEREDAARRRRKRLGYGGLALLALALATIPIVVFTVGGAESGPGPAGEQAEATAGHIHGLGIDPGSSSLYIATHNGLFRAARGQPVARRVGTSGEGRWGWNWFSR